MKCLICAGYSEPAFEAADTLHGISGSFVVCVCRKCGAGMTTPVVDERDLGAFYPSRYYTHERPTGVGVAMTEFYNWRRMARLRLMRIKPGALLELGPGDCSFLLFLKRRGWQVAGLDPDRAVVENGRQCGLEMFEGTAAAIPPRRFDAIVAWHSLEHSPEPVRDFRLLLGHLAPGGRLIIGVPDFGSYWARMFRGSWHNLDVPRHRVHFTRKALAHLVSENGALIADVRTWLSARAILESMKARWKLRLKGETAIVVALTPLCWILESLNSGDSLSAVVMQTQGVRT